MKVEGGVNNNPGTDEISGKIFERINKLNKGFILQNKSGEILIVNNKAAELLNTTAEELYKIKNIKSLWKDHWNITTEKGDPVPYEKTAFAHAFQTGKRKFQTLIIHFQTTNAKRLSVVSQPLFDHSGDEPFSVVSFFAESDYNKSHEEKVNEDELMLQYVKKISGLAWVLDEDSNLVFANQEFYQFFDLQENAISKSLSDQIPRYIFDTLYSKHASALQTGASIETVEKIKWVNGINIYFHITIFPLEISNGQKLVGGHALKIDKNNVTLKELRKTNERLLNFTRSASEAVWELDMKTGRVFRNEILLNMLGYPKESKRGLSWWLSRIHPDDVSRVQDLLYVTSENGQKTWEQEYRFRCADGSYKHVRDKGFILYENNKAVKMIGSIIDASELKNLEDKIIGDKLHHQEEIAESIILTQEKERNRIGQELHDSVNQVLTTAKLYLAMLKPADKENEILIAKTTEFILSAINEIRDISKDMVLPKFKDVSLIDNIRNLLDDISATGVFVISFSANQKDSCCLSVAKKMSIYRIVQEQLKNIIKYSQATRVNVELNFTDQIVQLLIKDNGIGFDPAQKKKGIGLQNIYDRTLLYNGEVKLNTRPGEGCLLEVIIPLN